MANLILDMIMNAAGLNKRQYDVEKENEPIITNSHPSSAYNYLSYRKFAVGEIEMPVTKDKSKYGQFVDIESPSYEGDLSARFRMFNINSDFYEELENVSNENRFKSDIDYSYAEKYAPKLAKNHREEIEYARKQTEQYYAAR